MEKILIAALKRLIALCEECNRQYSRKILSPGIGWTTRIDEIKTILRSAGMSISIERDMRCEKYYSCIEFQANNTEIQTVAESIGFKNGVYKF